MKLSKRNYQNEIIKKKLPNRKVKECRTRIKSTLETTAMNTNEERSKIKEVLARDE